MTLPLGIFCSFLSAAMLLTANPFCSLLGVASLLVLILLFWTRERPAIFFWALLYQWVQINSGVLWADMTGTDMKELFTYPLHAEQAFVLATCCLMTLGLGSWFMTKKIQMIDLDPWLRQLDTKKCIKMYLVFMGANLILQNVHLPGIFQIITALGFLKWGLFYLMFTVALKKREHLHLLIAIMAFEFISSTFSIFADFRSILIYPMMFFFAVDREKLTRGRAFAAISFAVILVNVAILWTAVKGDYRQFMAAGEIGQVIRVSRSEALGKLITLATTSANPETYTKAAKQLVDRLFYLDYLSGILKNVPDRLPHENGMLTWKTIVHITTPRFLYPEKEALHDSIHLNKYLGRFIADYRTTSMSIGYVGDLYIDYGYFAPLATFILGLLLGYCYRRLALSDPNPVWGVVLTVPIFLIIFPFEISLIKLVGLIMTYILVMLLIRRFVFPFLKRHTEMSYHSDYPAPARFIPLNTEDLRK